MAKNVNVSQDFGKFMAKNATAVEDARKTENTMQTCKMPIGWSGNAICTGAVADKGKDRKDDKGQTREGNPYVRLDFEVVNDEQYAGSKFSRAWSFYDSEKATATDRFTWMLNELENLGLPEELRRGEDFDLSQCLAFFAEGEAIYHCEVEHNAYRRGDQKEVKVTLMESVDSTDSVMPGSSSSDEAIEVGSMVEFMGKEWEVLDVDGDDIQIKSPKTGNTRTVTKSQLG